MILEKSSAAPNVADNMAKGIGFLFKKNKVDHFIELQVLVPGMVEIKDGKDSGKILSTEKVLIATGCMRNATLADLVVDGENMLQL